MTKVEKAIKTLVDKTKNDPVFFVKKVFGITPTFQQKEVLVSVARNSRTAVKAGHGVGKSAVASWLIYWFLITRPLARIPVTAPTMHQLKDILWAELGKWLFHSEFMRQIVDFTDTRLSIKGGYKKTWFAVPISARKPENLQGFHADNMLFIADEASGVPNENFEVIEGALTGKGNKMLLQGNPTQPEGYFYDAFNKNANMFRTITHSSKDSPIVEEDYVNNIAEKYGKRSAVYRYRVLGEFPIMGLGNNVIPAAWVEKAFDTPGNIKEGKRRIGVDVARYGDDETVIVIRKGHTVEAIYRIRSMDEVEIANEVIRLYFLYSPDEIAVETAGVGNGVFDTLKHRKLRVKLLEFLPNLNPEDTHTYENAITEAWFQLRQLFKPTANQKSMISINRDDDVLQQLTSRIYEVRENGKIKLEDKEKHKRKNNNESPDIGDALSIAFYEGRFRAGKTKTIQRRILTGSESEWERIREV